MQSATPANVDTVMVDGRIVKRGGRLVAYDVDKVVREAKASALRIRTAAGGRLRPPPAGLRHGDLHGCHLLLGGPITGSKA